MEDLEAFGEITAEDAPAPAPAPAPPPPPPPAPAPDITTPTEPAPSQPTPATASTHTPGDTRLAALEQAIAELRAFRDWATQELSVLRPGGATPPSPAAIVAPVAVPDDVVAELNELRRKNDELIAEYERVQGEYQALKLRVEMQEEVAPPPAVSAAPDPNAEKIDLSAVLAGAEVDDPKLLDRIKMLVSRNSYLATRNTELQVEVTSIKKNATAKFKRMKGETETVQQQKENLLKMLQNRDVQEGAGTEPAPLTLEQITASPVFKTMLGNIRRTSREEVTHLHDAIARMKEMNPEAYTLALQVVAEEFAKHNMENPLAMLPKIEG